MDECENYFEDVGIEWYFQSDEHDSKKVVPLFPYLQKLQIVQHRYFGSIVSEDVELEGDKFLLSQVILEVSGRNENDVKEELINGDWIRPQSGLTVFPPVVMVKEKKDNTLANIEWELRSGG